MTRGRYLGIPITGRVSRNLESTMGPIGSLDRQHGSSSLGTFYRAAVADRSGS